MFNDDHSENTESRKSEIMDKNLFSDGNFQNIMDMPEPPSDTIVLQTNHRDAYSIYNHSNEPLEKNPESPLERKISMQRRPSLKYSIRPETNTEEDDCNYWIRLTYEVINKKNR